MPTVRLGLLTLPLAGLLTLWATIASSAFFDFPNAAVDPQEVALAYGSSGYFLSQFVGYVLGTTLLTLGVFALTVYLSDIRGERGFPALLDGLHPLWLRGVGVGEVTPVVWDAPGGPRATGDVAAARGTRVGSFRRPPQAPARVRVQAGAEAEPRATSTRVSRRSGAA